jgi:hypothetical protein
MDAAAGATARTVDDENLLLLLSPKTNILSFFAQLS